MSRYDQNIEINVLDRATQALETIIAKAKELDETDPIIDVNVGSGFHETEAQIRTVREQLDLYQKSLETLTTKSSRVNSSKSIKKYLDDAKTLHKEINDIYRKIDGESVNEDLGSALNSESRRLQNTLKHRLESARATERETKALRIQAQQIQRANQAYQEFYNTVSRVKALSNTNVNGAYSYVGAFNAFDGSPASTNIAGLLGEAKGFTLQGKPYSPWTQPQILALPSGSTSTSWSYAARGGETYNPRNASTNSNRIYVDNNGNAFFDPYNSPIKALPSGSSEDVKTGRVLTKEETDRLFGGSSGSGGSGGGGIPVGKPQKGFFEQVLGTSLGKYITRLATYQMVSGAIYGTVKAFKDALTTMREVDSELASIQKVTDFTADQMAEIEESSYSVASQYGVSAQEYLESVSAFAKAGYKDLADDLGELAIKTQLVGDVTASTANQFLLSVDAAWKMNGSVEDLSRVLDEANVVENNYATSIDKLAQGLPNVASVASMAGMSAEETIAALGTITAVTQQSGTKAATALRALILNIMKDTTTEVEEGVTVTKEQISTLDEVLQVYAGDAIKAAQATGEIVNPMEVVAALAQAYQENRISDRDLAKIEMALGGKLRTNQLDALLKNFGMYNEMMEKISDSAGSADKEIGIMLDTWEAKAKILKNTWTEFVAKTLSTDVFKGILDGATKLLKVVGDLGTALEAVGGILAAKFMLNLPNLLGKLMASLTKISAAGGILKMLGAGGVAGIGGAVAAVAITGTLIGIQKYRQGLEDTAKTSLETAKSSSEQRDAIISLVNAYEQAAAGSEAQKEASAKLAEALGIEGEAVNSLASEYEHLTAVKAAQSTVDAAEAIASAEEALEAQNKFSWKLGVVAYDASLSNKNVNDIINRNLKQFDSEVDYENGQGIFRTSRDASSKEIIAFYDALGKAIKEVKDEVQKLPSLEEQTDIFNSTKYKSLVSTYNQLEEAVTGYRDAYKTWVESKATEEIFADRRKGLIDTQEEYDKYKKQLRETYKDEESLATATEVLQKMFPQFSGWVEESTTVLAAEETQLNATTNALERYKNAKATDKDGNAKKGEKDDNFKTVAGAFGTMRDEAKKNRFQSNAFQDAAALVLGQNYMSTHTTKEAKKHIDELQKMGVFNPDSAGTGLYNLIRNNKDVEKTADGYYAVADGLAAVKKNADGTFDFQISDKEADLEKVANVLGVSAESLVVMQQAMGVFDKTIDLSALETLLDKLEEARQKAEETKNNTEEAKKNAEETKEAAGDTSSKTSTEGGEKEPATVPVETEGAEEAKSELDSVKETAKELGEQTPKVTVTADVASAMTSLAAVGQRVNNLPSSKTITINIVVNGELPDIGGNAEGTSNFKGGLTWVNEQKGGFNPELIETGGKSFFVNGGKPALVALPKGAVIYNATETRKLLADGSDITEVMHHDNGTNIPLPERSGRIAGIGNGKGKGSSASSDDWWEKLQEYMEDLLEKADDALDKQLEAIEAELFYLQYGKEVSEKATELEEARMNLLEAEQELINAQTERTVRYFNAETGQWEWMADQKDIIKAQEELAERQKDYLKAQYDYLENVWNELKDDIQKAIDGKKDVNIASVLKQMLKSKAGGLTGNVEGLIGDLLNLITAFSSGTALDTYDSGGIANGLGYMYKATKADEVVLNGKLSNAILSPKRSQQFADFTSSLERMFGMSSMVERPRSMAGFSTTDSHNNIVYMNGIKIGSDMLNKPLSEVLSVLPIYCN